MGKISATLTELGIDHVSGIAETGVVAFLPSNLGGTKTIALRADIDALPIIEQTGLPYSSQHQGRMHACGHDGHTTILLATLEELSKTERPNHVLALFQPAEEGGAGGKRMVDEGVLKGQVIGQRADIIFGLHCDPGTTLGSVRTRTGAFMASAASFSILIKGKGAHAAAPHTGIDPIVIASHLVLALQTVASRTIDPVESVVVTIGQVLAGVAHNVIPETAWLNGTMRTLNGEVENAARTRIEAIVASIPLAFGGTAEITWAPNPYPVTRNDPDATDQFRRIAAQTIGELFVLEQENPVMGGEDFSYYGYEIPACFYFLGIVPEGQEGYPNLHAPTFNFNDDAIPIGRDLMAALARS